MGTDAATGRTVPIMLSGPGAGSKGVGTRLTLQEEEAGRTVLLAWLAFKRRALRRGVALRYQQQQQQPIAEPLLQ